MRPTPKGLLTAGATALGVAAVLVLNPTQDGTSVATTVTDGAASTATSPDQAAGPAAGATGRATDGGTEAGSDAATAAATEAAGSAAATTGVTGTYTGDAASSPYGDMQVSVTVENGTITDVTWVALPGDSHSQRINSTAAPTLVNEALQAQSADVASVSGATYTSEGFRKSLQSALTQAGL